MRFYNGKPIELLAPAGTFDIFKSVIHANCDAVYFGGSILNMRMIRKGYNFSNEEIEAAIKIAHDLGKKVYITVNNLFSHEDLDEAIPYLKFLESVQPDALIIQDFSLFQFVKDLNLDLELHSSVMMNVHNLETVHALRKLGISRVVTSREMSLETIKNMIKETDMEFEYFTHGDMCVAHGAQCIYSGMLFGMSSNRGRCLKPCRWSYDLSKDGDLYKTGFPLAVKDMCLYDHLPELIESGVTSFKLEGRMRDKDFITRLINLYGDAIDQFLKAPESFDPSEGMSILQEHRKRDLSTGYAFGKPGLDYINNRYEGTGKFYSTGKVFSTPTEEAEINDKRLAEINKSLFSYPKKDFSRKDSSKKLAVKVDTMAQALVCLKENVDVLYLSSEQYCGHSQFVETDYLALIESKGRTEIYLALPKMMMNDQFAYFDMLLMDKKIPFDGLLCTNLGAINRYKDLGYKLTGDNSLNCYNHKALKTYTDLGVDTMTASLEMPLKDIASLGQWANCPLEVIVHGRPTVMYLEHDLYENTKKFDPVGKRQNQFISDEILSLITPAGEYPVLKDHFGRNHILGSKELCYMGLLAGLTHVGYEQFRIEGAAYNTDDLKTIITTYKKSLADPSYEATLHPISQGYTLGAFNYD